MIVMGWALSIRQIVWRSGPTKPSLTEFLTENDRRSAGRPADGRTDGASLWGCEQHRRRRDVHADAIRRATDLAVWGSRSVRAS